MRDLSRRIYRELVRGRTRVRVVSEDAGHASGPPRFILSPYRSGTTLLRYALDSHADLASPPETHYLASLTALLDDPLSMRGLNDLGFDDALVRSKLTTFARSFLDTYAEAGGATAWIDKSPRYAEDPFAVLRLFPDALTIVLHRHPLDQVHSFTRGGSFAHPALGTDTRGSVLLIRAGEYWAEVTEGLLRVQDELGGRSLTVRYEDLCASPEGALRAILAQLELPWDPEVLNYDKHDHDVGHEAGRVIGTVGFSRSWGGWRKWDPQTVQDVWAKVAAPATKLGYLSDGSATQPITFADHRRDLS
jgi:protein-tyrosine sulfotransferase